ncbi:MAG TPA: hypothetical protein VN951_09430 [Pyrinomonadaceae bacterium]|nr:hypothetical protein [Pyrinomonadaceae bacterium]
MDKREQVRGRISDAFADFELPRQTIKDIAFHMTDWKENLDDLASLYEKPEQFSDGQIQKMVLVFLAHVPNHVAAAKKLVGLGPIEDVFEVGVMEEDK